MRKAGYERRRKLCDEVKAFPLLVKLHKGETVEVKTRKERAKETRPREQPERELREHVIAELRKKGIKVMRLENSIVGKNNTGMPDLWVVNVYKNKAGWMELKSDRGILTGNQPQFRADCLRCNVNHWVVRSLGEAMEAIL
jgi:hypothetical protein